MTNDDGSPPTSRRVPDPLVMPFANVRQQLGIRYGSLNATFAADVYPPAEVVEHFAATCDLAARYDVTCDLENLPMWGVKTIRQAWSVVAAAGRPNGGIVFDILHYVRGGSTPDMLAEIPGDRVHCVQLNDGPLRLPPGVTLEENCFDRGPPSGPPYFPHLRVDVQAGADFLRLSPDLQRSRRDHSRTRADRQQDRRDGRPGARAGERRPHRRDPRRALGRAAVRPALAGPAAVDDLHRRLAARSAGVRQLRRRLGRLRRAAGAHAGRHGLLRAPPVALSGHGGQRDGDDARGGRLVRCPDDARRAAHRVHRPGRAGGTAAGGGVHLAELAHSAAGRTADSAADAPRTAHGRS